ncbi:MAG TPA: macro domain-containing protein [Anaerolineae bacterium]|nr:macro domain-containing protein [Anaerolineae bacterium]
MNNILASNTYSSGQQLEIAQGDITQEKVGAIVNAANAQLMHGGGVAAAIVYSGGAVIQKESNEWVHRHGTVSHAKPAYTSAGNLPCKYVIHAVGPVWGEGKEDEKLRAAIQGSLELAEDLGLTSIAFPAISTGIFGFPKKLAAEIFMDTISTYFERKLSSPLAIVRLTLYDNQTMKIFLRAFKKKIGKLDQMKTAG